MIYVKIVGDRIIPMEFVLGEEVIIISAYVPRCWLELHKCQTLSVVLNNMGQKVAGDRDKRLM